MVGAKLCRAAGLPGIGFETTAVAEAWFCAAAELL